ncbi:hypothetical protein Mal4_03400 [Maioricimonas rarisocia]|uniref:Uncharacterized protein n=1 Tax=Maioricimonas rarisocia TaxID=2528026 RepID=A0A517Z0Q3_9PLAN|nr:hypothetical protein [Maioricimonas rarisocia]QDU36057.1 hypothetical protein Mal4_03400 [Maioricimonas rarisocia]
MGVVLAGEVSCIFHEDETFDLLEQSALESKWNSLGRCKCLSCGWEGLAGEVMSRPDSARNQISPSEIEAIEQELGGPECPDDLRENVQRLVDAYKLLQAQLAVVARVNSSDKGSSGQAGDTSIL